MFEEKADFWLWPDFFLQKSSKPGARELGTLDGRMLARALTSQLTKVSTTIIDLGATVFLFLRDVSFKKRGFR